jgi:hypothetical protein
VLALVVPSPFEDRPCRAWPADRSLVAEDRSAIAVRDRTGPEPAVIVVAWSAPGPHGFGNRWSSAGTSGHDGHAKTAGHAAATATTSHGEAQWGRVQVPQPACREPAGLLPTRRWSPRTGLTHWTSWEPSPPRANDRRSRRPCHPRATSSGHELYPAVSHGHSQATVELGTGPLTWTAGTARHCMA